MNSNSARLTTVFAAAMFAAILAAQCDAAEDLNLTATAFGSGILRLSVAAGAAPRVLPSTALASAEPPTGEGTVEGQWMGLRTKGGTLLILQASHQWKLEGPDGKTLVTGCAASDSGIDGADAGLRVELKWSKAKEPRIYGSGNDVGSLLHRGGRTAVGNGLAVVPYFWCSDGYAMLVVNRTDAAPPGWTTHLENRTTTWTMGGSTADLYLMPAADLRAAAITFGRLSGTAPVPPRWAFGYLQSRWGWEDRRYLEQTLHEFRSRELPVDAFICDFEWYTPQPDYEVPPAGIPGFPDFGWNPRLFPDPKEQLADFQRQGLRFIGIRKPRLGDEQNLKSARENRWSLGAHNQPGGQLFEARDMDFSNPQLRQWYARQLEPMLAMGIAGWWNDEGEATLTNYYYWNEAERTAAAKVYPGRRFWSINRAFQPGLQRLGAAAWTGDIDSTWATLAATPGNLLNWSLAGMPYGACDIGGFNGNDSPELLVRWMQAGVFFPVMRTHSTLRSRSLPKVTPRFPWLYGPEAETAIRGALDLRYRLLPLYYSLAHEQARTGLPLMRPMAMEFPTDPRAAELTEQWMMGDQLLAAPMLAPGNEREVYLPKGTWYRFGTAQKVDGGRWIREPASLFDIPIFVRAGTVLPLGPILQTTAAAPGGPLSLQIYPGADARFTLWEDDGETMQYCAGAVRRTTFSWNDASRRLNWQTEGNYAGPDIYQKISVEVFDAATPEVETLVGMGEWAAPGAGERR